MKLDSCVPAPNSTVDDGLLGAGTTAVVGDVAGVEDGADADVVEGVPDVTAVVDVAGRAAVELVVCCEVVEGDDVAAFTVLVVRAVALRPFCAAAAAGELIAPNATAPTKPVTTSKTAAINTYERRTGSVDNWLPSTDQQIDNTGRSIERNPIFPQEDVAGRCDSGVYPGLICAKAANHRREPSPLSGGHK